MRLFNQRMNENNKVVDVINLIHNISYLTPTTKLKELLLLQHIEESPDTTQKEMAEVISAAPSMVNVYLKEYEENKYIKREYVSAKTVKYLITPEGLKRKNFLLITYVHELLKLYRLAEDHVHEFLRHLEDMGYRKVLFYGAGEVAETILGIVASRTDRQLEVVGVIDDDAGREQERLLGTEIIARDRIGQYEHDVIVITSYTFEDEIMGKLEDMAYPKEKVVRFFSG